MYQDKEKVQRQTVDLTPMVDVTFLLLVFFMVTQSYTRQQALPHPPAFDEYQGIAEIEKTGLDRGSDRSIQYLPHFVRRCCRGSTQ